LPSAGQSATPEKPLISAKRELAIEGRILLVEDEEAILELERDVLTGAGAQVVTLSHSEDVKARLLQESFDAVVMSGKIAGGWNVTEAHQWLKEECPGLERRVMVTFSNDPQPETRAFLIEHSIPFLVKPFEVGEVITQTRRLLQKTHSAAAGM
jgi:DNA-binding NtrC family response regulator